MKKLKMMLLLSVFTIGISLQSMAQDLMPGVTVKAANYKYLKSVADTGTSLDVRRMQQRAAAYDIKNSEYYEEEYEYYFISFYIPDGEILAAYDQDGKLLRTAEKFKNVSVPSEVRNAVVKRFPNWSLTQDVYLVNYNEGKGAKKVYKFILENGDKRMRIKTDEKGNVL